MKQSIFIITAIIAPLLTPPLFAEEGGTGHHLPGSGISLTGILPAEPGLTVKFSNWYYNGAAGGSASLGSLIPNSVVNDGVASLFGALAGGRGLPPTLQSFVDRVSAEVNARLDATNVTLNLGSKQNISTLSLIYVTPWKPLGGLYAVGVSLPLLYVETDVTFEVYGPKQGKTLHVSDSNFGFSDMVILPGIIGWDRGDWHWTVGLGIFAPTGEYSPNDLAPLGKNFWSFEPFAGFTYLNAKTGIELSLGAALDFNTENPATHYRSGDQVNLEWLVAQHLPGGFSVGVTGYYYQQITGDSGGGATDGSFLGRTTGIGPTLGYTWKDKLAMNVQWFHEYDTLRRFEGDVISLNVGWTF